MKKFFVIFTFILLLFPVSIYASPKYLYDVLKSEAEIGTFAREYTGNHGDSMDTSLSTKKIYHWYAESDSVGSQVLEKNNVIFADICWQMIRTTDTGGVKLVYNGKAVDGKCLSTRDQTEGYTDFNNTRNLSSDYYYGTDYTFDGNQFHLAGDISTGEVKLKQYTCYNTNPDASCQYLYYVIKNKSGSSYYMLYIGKRTFHDGIGSVKYNMESNSPAYVGYMYGNKYPIYLTDKLQEKIIDDYIVLRPSYHYGTSALNNEVNHTYTLVNPTTNIEITPSNVVNKYVSEYGVTSPTVKLILDVYQEYNSNTYTARVITMTGGKPLSDFITQYSYGDSYSKSGSIYTIDDYSTTNKRTLYSNSNSIVNKYVCKSSNGKCNELWYVTSAINSTFYYLVVNNNYKYASGYSYDASTNTYTLTGESDTFWNWTSDGKIDYIKNHPYTCFNESGTCETLGYYYYVGQIQMNYVELNNNKTPMEALEEMLYSDNVNENNSTEKEAIDAWYKHSISQYYDGFVEDTIYCNNRVIDEYGGWDQVNGDKSKKLLFKNNNAITDLNCEKITDRFSVSNPKARLTYKVGLLTKAEANLLNNSAIRKSKVENMLLSPLKLDSYDVDMASITPSGTLASRPLSYDTTIRPSISLKDKIRYSSGNGTTNDPYVIDYNTYYSIHNEDNRIHFNVEDLESVKENDNITFNITPLSGYRVKGVVILNSNNESVPYVLENGNYSFVMPNSDVTVVPTYEKYKYSVSVVIKNETKNIIINLNDLTSVTVGENVAFNITPIEGYKLSSVSIKDKDNHDIVFEVNNNGYAFVMPNSDVTITPSYEKVTNSITVEDNDKGEIKINVNDSSAVVYDDIVIFTVTPQEGYKVDNIIIIDNNDNNVPYENDNNKYTFTMPASNVTISPSYKKVVNPITIEDNKNSKEVEIEIENKDAVEYESIVRIKVVPKDGYIIEEVRVTDKEGNKIPCRKTVNDNEYEFMMPASAVNIEPIYRKASIPEGGVVIPDTWASNLLVVALVLLVIGGITYFIIKRKSKKM